MQRERAANLLAQMQGRRVLVLGDLIFDSFVYGAVNRLSREAPVPVLSERSRQAMLGGAANLARNIASLGGQVHLVSVTGDDLEGGQTRALAQHAFDRETTLVMTPGRATPAKTRFVAQNQQMFCVDRDPDGGVDQQIEDALLSHIEERLGSVEVLAISDYGRGLLTPALLKRVIEAARAASVPVCVDPRGKDFSRYDGATVIKPNADELASETGMSVASPDAVQTALAALKSKLPDTDALLVTRGGQGMCLLDNEGQLHHHASKARSVFDVSGAGDTALAALSLSIAAGIELAEAMAVADLAAGVAVGKSGTAVVTPEEILDDAHTGAEPPGWRVLAQGDAAELSKRWRTEGLRVGFTNGCFDILHPGHLSVLRHAASVCDRLIVGLNSDASVKRLKGAERPINSVETRALMLASLEMVDRVVVFEEDTPQALIEALVPGVMIKGADYIADDLPGAAFVTAQGGEVVLAPLLEGLSTTGFVEKLKER